MNLIILVSSLVISAIAKAIMDLTAQGVWSGWWNKNQSWKRKWKNGDPNLGEAFFGSSTFLVWTTDWWHFFQMIFLNFWFIGMIHYEPIFESKIQDFFLFMIGYKIVFELSYRLIKKIKT